MNKLNSSIKDVKDKGLIADYKEKQRSYEKDDGNFITKYGSFFLKGIKTQY